MTNTVLRKTIFLKAPRAKVWAYLTEPDKLALWFHPPKVAMAEGAPLEMFGAESGDKLIWGKVQVARAPEYLEYTFTVKPMGEAVSLVKWTLDDVPGGTQLSLEHEGLPQSADAFDLILALDDGWDKHLMQMRNSIHGKAA
jgi:uncharacterized protein YndB with AHSA1/START domain